MSTLLTGTDNQITWVAEIRTAYTTQLSALKSAMVASGADMSDPRRSDMIAKLDAVAAVSSAAWWIDNKSYLAVRSVAELANGTLKNIIAGAVKLP